MNTKRFFAAIFAAAILSISFLACDPKEDDPTTNQQTTTDVVKEIYGYYGKSTPEVLPFLDAKGWTKTVTQNSVFTKYEYLNSDRTKRYLIVFKDDRVVESTYDEIESSDNKANKLGQTATSFISTFEKWDASLREIYPANAYYSGHVFANNFSFFMFYDSYSEFLEDFQEQKPTLQSAESVYISNIFNAQVGVDIDYESAKNQVYIYIGEGVYSPRKL